MGHQQVPQVHRLLDVVQESHLRRLGQDPTFYRFPSTVRRGPLPCRDVSVRLSLSSSTGPVSWKWRRVRSGGRIPVTSGVTSCCDEVEEGDCVVTTQGLLHSRSVSPRAVSLPVCRPYFTPSVPTVRVKGLPSHTDRPRTSRHDFLRDTRVSGVGVSPVFRRDWSSYTQSTTRSWSPSVVCGSYRKTRRPPNQNSYPGNRCRPPASKRASRTSTEARRFLSLSETQ